MNTKLIVRRAFFTYADIPKPTSFMDNGGSSYHKMLICGPWEEEVSTGTGRSLGSWISSVRVDAARAGERRAMK